MRNPTPSPPLLCRALAALAATVIATPCAAQPVAANTTVYSAPYAQCMQRAGAENAAMHDCTSAELKHQDQRLNAAYAQLRKNLPAPRLRALQLAQRDWIRYRDSNCAFINDPEGGTHARLSAGQCLLSMTAARAGELEELLQQR